MEIERIVEHCCYQRQLSALLNHAEQEQKPQAFYTNSDVDIRQLLPFMSRRIQGGTLTICMVQLTENTVEVLETLMREKAAIDGTKQFSIAHLNLLFAKCYDYADVASRLKPWADRTTVAKDTVSFRCITMMREWEVTGLDGEAVGCSKAFTLHGSINQQLACSTQLMIYDPTTDGARQILPVLESKMRVKRIKNFFTKNW